MWLDAQNAKLVATDGHRMIVTPVLVSDGDTTGRVTTEALTIARSKCKVRGSDTIEVSANGCHALPNGWTMPRPANQDPFPPYEKVVPKAEREGARSFGVNAKYLASVFAAIGDSDKPVKITIGDPLEPILFEHETTLGTTTIVIMPMRL